MKVKGSLISSAKQFVETKFEARYGEWEDGLPIASKDIYSNSIMASEWYEFDEGIDVPTRNIAGLFYNGDIAKAGWEMGRFAADVGLKGIYKVFVLIATPQYIMKRASKILSSFYDVCSIEVVSPQAKSSEIHLTNFIQPSEMIENRVGGWMERALEICGVKNISVQKKQSVKDGFDRTIFAVNWQ